MAWSFASWRTEVGQFRGHRVGRLEQKRAFYVKWMRCHFMIKFENYLVDDEGGYYPGSALRHILLPLNVRAESKRTLQTPNESAF